MRLRTGAGLLLVAAGGCAHLPRGVAVDVAAGEVVVGPCRCTLPAPVAGQAAAGPAPAPKPAVPAGECG